MVSRSQLEEMPTLNLTSMIDVLFLLIIFFMVGTKFIESERQIELKLPQVSSKQALSSAPEKKIVNVYRDGAITLDGKQVTLTELSQRLATLHGQYRALGVLVRGDGTTQLQRVVDVFAVCKQVGIVDLSVGVETAGKDSPHARR